MISLLARFFCKSDGKSPAQLRTAYGILCGAVGIGLNLLLFLGKFFAGTLSGSVAITADAFNNLSDAGSSVVTLLGFRIAAKAPDPGHPFGHGRAEYLSGLAVSMLILLMGVELAKESLNKILHPALVEFSWLVIGILAASICVKLYMAMYNRSLGKKLSAPALLAAAADSLGDCMSTSAVLVATLIGHYFQLPVDGWVGILVALLIFKGGIDAAKDTIDPLLGKPPTPEFVKEIEDLVMTHKEISGIHDLVVHDYGPGRVMISLHAEVPATGSVMTIHDTIDNIEQELHRKLGCEAVIHMDPIATDDSTTVVLRNKITELAHCIDPALSIHDFRMVPGPTHTNLIFDVVTPFGFRLEDAEVVLTAYGISARICKSAVELLRAQGVKAGLIRPITVHPFPYAAYDHIDYSRVEAVLDVEMSIPAQFVDDVAVAVKDRCPIETCLCSGGNIMSRDKVLAAVKKIMEGK